MKKSHEQQWREAHIGWADLPAKPALFEVLTFLVCIVAIIVQLVHVRGQLPPAYSTRHRKSSRRNQVVVFMILALLSLSVTGYFRVVHLIQITKREIQHERMGRDMQQLPTG